MIWQEGSILATGIREDILNAQKITYFHPEKPIDYENDVLVGIRVLDSNSQAVFSKLFFLAVDKFIVTKQDGTIRALAAEDLSGDELIRIAGLFLQYQD